MRFIAFALVAVITISIFSQSSNPLVASNNSNGLDPDASDEQYSGSPSSQRTSPAGPPPRWTYSTGQSILPATSRIMSRDGSIIAASCDGTGRIYAFNKKSNSTLWIYNTGQTYVPCIAVSSDGNYIAVGAYTGSSANLYLFKTYGAGAPLWTYSASGYFLNDGVDISGNGTYITAVVGTKLMLFRNSSSTPQWSNTLGDSAAVAISNDGNYLFIGTSSYDQKFYLFSKTSSTPIWISTATGSWAHYVDISDDGSYMAGGTENGKVYLFGKGSKIPLWTYTLGGDIRSISISSDGSTIAAGSMSGKVIVFAKTGNTPAWTYDIGSPIGCIMVSPDATHIIAGPDNGLIHLFNRTTCVPIWVYNSGSGPHHTVALSRNAKQVAFGGNKLYFLETSVKVFADVQNENPGTYVINDTLSYIRWLNGSTATGSVDSTIFNYDLLVVSVVDNSASHYYTSTEKQLVDQFLRSGKVVLMITSDDQYLTRIQITNDLLAFLGASVSFSGHYSSWPFLVINPMHPLANNISSFVLSGGYPVVSGTGGTTIARDSLLNAVLAESRVRNGSIVLATWQVFSNTTSSSDARQFVRNLLSYSSSLAQAAPLPVAVGGLFADIQNENPPNYLINDALSFVRTIGWNTTTGSISSGIASYNLLVISAVYDNANHYYTSTEKQMVDQFLRSGKIVLIITSDDLHAARVQICNELLTSLGTGETFNGYYTNWPFQVVNSSHPLAHNISRFSLTGGHPVITGSGAATIVRDSSSNTVLAECRIGNGKIILTTWQIFCMTASSSDVRQFVKNLLSYTGYVPQPQVSPPTVLIPSSGNNATTPAGFFEENGFSVITHNAANVSIAIWASSPPETTATLSGKSTYIFLEIEGTFIPGTSVITVYIFYNRTKVQGLGIDEHSMKLYTWNSTTSTWEELTQPDGSPASNVVVLNNTHGCIVGYLYHLSYFAVFGTALPVGIGTSTTVLIMAVAGIVVALCMVLVIRMRKGASLPKEESDEWKAGRSGAAESAKMAE